MKAVILAGGLGTRLKPFTEVIPKPLLPIGEKAVLEIQIEHLKKHGFKEIYLATNYKSDYIEKFFGDGSRYGVKLIVSRENKPLGTVGPLTLLKSELKDHFVVMNGDVLSNIDFTKFYNYAIEKDTLLTVSVKKIVMPYDFGNIFFNEDYVIGIEEKPDMITYALAGIYIMKPDIFSVIPENQYFGMDILIKNMLSEQIPISKYELSEYWLDIGRIDDYEIAQKDFNENFYRKNS
jgi:NDP-sugar pyrophosphorylase family protein